MYQLVRETKTKIQMNTGSKNINLFLAFYKYKNLALAGIFVFMGLMFFAGANNASAATATGSAGGATTANVGCGDNSDWENTDQMGSSDDSYASSEVLKGGCSYYLFIDNFGFSIPAGATINGIQADMERFAQNGGVISDAYVALHVSGSPSGDNMGVGGTWGTSDYVQSYGGSANTWNSGYGVNDINSSGFGVVIYVTAGSPTTFAYIDQVVITVTYTPGSYTCQSITSGNGNWNAAGSWTSCGGGTPGSADTAVINGTANITVTSSTTVSALKFGTTAAAATAAVLKIDSGQTLTVISTTTMVGTAGTATQATIQNGTGSGTLTTNLLYIGETVTPSSTVTNKLISTISNLNVVVGDFQPIFQLTGYANGASYNNPSFELQSGTLTTKNITTSLPSASNTATVTMATGSQNGTMILTHGTPWTISGTGTSTTTLNGTSSTVEYSGTNAAIRNTTYTGLKVSGNVGTTAQTATVTGLLNVTGTMTPSSGTITLNNGSSITNSGTLTFYNVTTASSATVTGNSSFSVGSGGTFTIGSSSTFTPAAANVITGTSATITGTGTVQVTRTSATADFNTQYAFTTKTLTSLTVDYAGASQTISSLTYGGLKVSGSVTASATATVGGTLTVTGTLTPSAGTITLNNGASIVNSGTLTFQNVTVASSASVTTSASFSVAGTLTNSSSGSLIASAGLITFNNGSTISNSGAVLRFYSMQTGVSASINANTDFEIVNSFTVGTGGNFNSNSGTVTLRASASLNNSGTMSFQNLATTVNAAATGDTDFTVKGTLSTALNSAFTSSAGTQTFNNGSSISNALTGTLQLNNLTIANSATFTANTTYTVAGALSIGTGATLAPSSGTLTLSGTGTPLSVSGTFSPTGGTVSYTGTTATVTATTFYNLTLGGTGTYTMPGSTTTIKGNFSVTSGATVTKGAGTLVFSGTSNQTITDSNGTKQDLGAIQDSTTTDAWCNISSVACNSSWLARRKITFDNSTLSGNLTSFPVLVSVTSSQIDYAKTQNRGQDIRFVDADGTTALSYEIEKWDESGTSLIWVKVPTLSNNTTDYIYMYYNNTSVADNQSASSVWDSNHKGVWHLSTDTSLSTTDSTTNANTGNNTSATATTGKVDGGASLNGITSRIIAPATSSLDVSSGAGITVDGWFNPADVSGMRPLIEWGNSGSFGVHMWNYPQSGNIYVNVVDSGGTNHTFQTTGTPLTASTWQHVGFTYNKSSGAVALYHNGTAQSISSSNIGAFTPKTNLDLNIGYRPYSGGQYYYSGSTDEVRVSDVVRSADWFKAEYNSANNTMNSFGTEEVYGATGLTLGSSIKATSVTVDSGKIFSLGGSYTLTLTGNGASVFVVSGTFVPSTGTVEFASASTTGTTIPALTYYGLTINKASNTFTAAGSIVVNSFAIYAGTFVAPATTLTVNNFVNNGTFTHNSGTVVIGPTTTGLLSAGIENSVTTTFNNVSIVTPGLTVQVLEGSTNIFAGTLTITGSSGNPILIRSMAGAEQWFATFSTLPVLSYLNVLDSGCSGGLTAAQSATVYNQGNNGSCWGFVVNSGGGGSSGGGAGSSSVSDGASSIFTASGSWTAPAGITSVDVAVWGAGGGSGYYSGGAGGGGAYSRKNAISVTPGNSYTVTVGAGGNETVGGDSWFSATNVVLAKGGGLGVYGFNGGGPPCTGGAGGSAAAGVGDVKYSGGNGGTGDCYGGMGAGGGGGAGSSSDGANGSGATYGAGGTGNSGGHGGTGVGHNIPPTTNSWGENIGGGAGSWSYYLPAYHPRGGRGEVRIYYNGASGGDGDSGSSGGGAGSGGSSQGGGATNSGARSAGTLADDATVGSVAWTNPSNAQTSDDVYTTSTGIGVVSHYLKATNYGFSIPSTATINGIYVELEKKAANTITDSEIKIIKANGALGNTNKLSGLTWPISDTYSTYGGSADLWGESWTYNDINDADFGVAVSANVTGTGGSFHEDVMILTPFGEKKIKDLKKGDFVWSFNDKQGTMEIKEVIGSWSFPIEVDNNRYFYIYANGKVTKATENHRYYVNGDYIRADELKVGDILTDFNLSTYPIEKIEIVSNTVDLVWDIEVQDNHNFYANGILVHNPPTATAYIDHARITVYYSTSAPGQGGGGGGASP